ncbi:MAG: hypothetical protein QJR06_08950 [Alicyclobacillaceae bacterium]|nr:hypothetical protein [Alicyclobacillaceae bacterium]
METEIRHIPLLPGVRGLEVGTRPETGEIWVRPLYQWEVPGGRAGQFPEDVAGVLERASVRRFGRSCLEVWRRMRDGSGRI